MVEVSAGILKHAINPCIPALALRSLPVSATISISATAPGPCTSLPTPEHLPTIVFLRSLCLLPFFHGLHHTGPRVAKTSPAQGGHQYQDRLFVQKPWATSYMAAASCLRLNHSFPNSRFSDPWHKLEFQYAMTSCSIMYVFQPLTSPPLTNVFKIALGPLARVFYNAKIL